MDLNISNCSTNIHPRYRSRFIGERLLVFHGMRISGGDGMKRKDSLLSFSALLKHLSEYIVSQSVPERENILKYLQINKFTNISLLVTANQHHWQKRAQEHRKHAPNLLWIRFCCDWPIDCEVALHHVPFPLLAVYV